MARSWNNNDQRSLFILGSATAVLLLIVNLLLKQSINLYGSISDRRRNSNV
ncbi:hypothetical protein [Sutcliffiella horikoshii]|uniref:hypothetical protein n=1 Tax=Sutcliffiella horikoshii TaxID=79883 RepID=UPI001CFEB82D|nr:hypothetical protein [Sutcliffiella horikoshii]